MFVHTEICDHCKKQVSSFDSSHDYRTSGLRLTRFENMGKVNRQKTCLPDGHGVVFEINKPVSFVAEETVLNSYGSSHKNMYFTVPGVVCSAYCFEQFITIQLNKLMLEASKLNDPS